MGKNDINIDIYTREWCPYCRRAKAFLQSKGLSFTEHEISDDEEAVKEMVKRSGGQKTVPQIFFDNKHIGGYDDLIELETSGRLNSILGLPTPDYSEKKWDLIIVGAGPAGLAASVYAARKGLSTLLVATSMGGQVLETDIIDNYMGKPEISGSELMFDFWNHVQNYDVDSLLGGDVIDIKKQEGEEEEELLQVETRGGKELTARSVIIASGTQKRKLGVKGENRLKGKGVHYCAICDGFLYSDQPVAIVGGGNSGLEAALDMNKINSKVSLIEIHDSLGGDKVLRDQVNGSDMIDVYTSYEVLEILGDKKVESVKIRHRNTGRTSKLDVSAIFIEIGLIPNSGFVCDLVGRNDKNEIIINENNETDIPGIFAAGDVTNVNFKQIMIAAAEGAKAALRVNEYLG